MGTFAETVIVNYRLTFAYPGKKFPFSVSIYCKQTPEKALKFQWLLTEVSEWKQLVIECSMKIGQLIFIEN
jgi:hypothetical protein